MKFSSAVTAIVAVLFAHTVTAADPTPVLFGSSAIQSAIAKKCGAEFVASLQKDVQTNEGFIEKAKNGLAGDARNIM